MSNPENIVEGALLLQKQVYSSYKKLHLSHSHKKDKIAFSASRKKRQSARESILANFTQVRITKPSSQTLSMTDKAKKQNSDKVQINMEIVRKNEHLKEQIKKKNSKLETIIQQIIQRKQMIEKVKEISEKTRKEFHQSASIVEFLQESLAEEQKIGFDLKNKLNNLSYDIKKQFYEVCSEEKELEEENRRLDEMIEQQQDKFTAKIQKLEIITDKVITSENKAKEYKEEHQEVLMKLQQTKRKQEIEQSQLFILKLQLNPNYFAGFNVSSAGQNKQLLFDTAYVTWSSHKQKKVTVKDLKRFILIQLYPGWKKLLRKLSYQSSQYQVLFGQTKNEVIIDSLRETIYGEPIRASTKKLNKTIVISSPNNSQTVKNQLKEELEGFNNGLIEISSVNFQKLEDSEALQIIYKTLGSENKIEVYQIRMQDSLTREELLKLARAQDRRLFCFIQIPLIITKAEMPKYEELYDLVRKRSIKF